MKKAEKWDGVMTASSMQCITRGAGCFYSIP